MAGEPSDLATLLADPARVADIPPAEVPSLLVRLAAVQTALAARLTTPPSPKAGTDPDRLLTVREAATSLNMSPKWLYKHARALPFTRHVGRRLRFSRNGLDRYLATRRGG